MILKMTFIRTVTRHVGAEGHFVISGRFKFKQPSMM